MSTFVTAIFKAKEGKADELEKIFRSLVEPTHSDPGCISYALNRDQRDDHRFVFMEEWESRELLKKHLKARHIEEGLSKASGIIASQDIIMLDRLEGGDVAKN